MYFSFDSFSLQVKALQCKWISDILAKAFNCKGAEAWSLTEASLQLFLPADFDADQECLNPTAGDLLSTIRSMIHKTSDLELALDRLSTVWSSNNLGGDCKGMLKIKNTTHFKKLQATCHQMIATSTLDNETLTTAKELEADLPKINERLCTDINGFTLNELTQYLNDVGEIHERCASLPQSSISRHSGIREEGRSICDASMFKLEGSIGALVKQL